MWAKTAQRLILELKSTFAKDKGFVPVDVISGRSCDARALRSLGDR
ncbi:MAG: hypothetical protein ACLU0O_01500 [Collinsella sp.]